VSENPAQEKKAVWKLLVVFTLAALLSPHTFEISSQSIIDASFTRYSVITVLLTVFYESGSTIAGPYNTLFIMPPTSAALLNALTLVLNISIILSLWGLAKGVVSPRRALQLIGIVLCVHIFLLLGVFSYQADGWANVLALPLPIFPLVSALVVLRGKI
jgi:hypothetical protein